MKTLLFLCFSLSANLEPSIKTNPLNKHIQGIEYCSKKEVAINILKSICNDFWLKALQNPSFYNAIDKQSEKLELKNPKIFFKVWKKHVLSLAYKESVTYLKNEKKIYPFIKLNGDIFYNIIQIISQHIDFSNKIYKPFISRLVSDLAECIPSLDENEDNDLPVIDFKSVEEVLKKAIKIRRKNKKYNLDKFKSDEATQHETEKVNKKINNILKHLDNLSSVKSLTDKDLCHQNGISSGFFYNYGEDFIVCNENWLNCTAKDFFVTGNNLLNGTARGQNNLTIN